MLTAADIKYLCHFDLTGVERTSATVLNMTSVDQYFQRFGCYIDKLGRGLPMVIREIEKLGKILSFQEIGEEFVVTLSRE